jgi:hypothetical protein
VGDAMLLPLTQGGLMFWLIFIANWLLSFVLSIGLLFSAALLTLIGLKMPVWGDTVWETLLFYCLSSLIWLPLMIFMLKNKQRDKVRWAFWIAWLPPLVIAAIVISWAMQSHMLALVVLLPIVVVQSFGGYVVMGVMSSLAFAAAAKKSFSK